MLEQLGPHEGVVALAGSAPTIPKTARGQRRVAAEAAILALKAIRVLLVRNRKPAVISLGGGLYDRWRRMGLLNSRNSLMPERRTSRH
jgi:hypothetical protein